MKSRSREEPCLDGPRLVRPEELYELDDLMTISFGGALRPRGGRRRRRPRWIVRSGAWVVARDGRLVSHIKIAYNTISLYGCRLKIASIGGVCTHPDYRAQGIATILLDHCIAESARAGASLLLISGERRLYRRAHAVDAIPTLEGRLTPTFIEPASPPVTAHRGTAEDWFACASLYQSEPVRFVRRAEFFRQAFEHGHSETWVIDSNGSPAAYVMLSRHGGSSPENRRRVVAEYAGSRAALADGLPALFEAGGYEQIELAVPMHDGELAGIFARRGISLKAGTLEDHTIRLLDVDRLMRRLGPYVAARLPRSQARRLSFHQKDDGCIFSLGDEKVELSLAKSAALVLGGPEAPKAPGELGRLLASLFPVPFPMPGMNYV